MKEREKFGTRLGFIQWLPAGCFITVIDVQQGNFCVSKNGWGWDNFTKEANAGKGLKQVEIFYGG